MNLLRPERNGIVEASRFVFAPEARSGGYTKFFVEAAIARMLYHHRYSGIMLACHHRHAALYRRYGFKQIVDGNQNDYNGLAASILSLQIPDIRPALQSKIQEMGLAQQVWAALPGLPAAIQQVNTRYLVTGLVGLRKKLLISTRI